MSQIALILKKQRSATVLLILLICGVAGIARAQTSSPQILITWQAHTYAPPAFSGKRLPALGAMLDASLEIIDKGKSISLSNYNVYWYLDDELLGTGKGLRRVTFPTSNIAAGTMDLRVQIPDYPGGMLLKTIEIPVVRPSAVIKHVTSDSALDKTFSLEGLPYFFNVSTLSSLRFTWRVNGASPAGNSRPDIVTVQVNADAPAGAAIGASLAVQNIQNPLEAASRKTTITLSP